MKDQEKETHKAELKKAFVAGCKSRNEEYSVETYDKSFNDWIKKYKYPVSPPPEEQKVRDRFEVWLRESIEMATEDRNSAVEDMERAIRNGVLISYKNCLSAYLKHTPKQKESVKDSDIDNIMGRFYFNLEKTNPDGGDVQGCYDKYREELKELFSPKAPEKEGGGHE